LKEDSFQKAKNYAFLLLKYRLRSESEIRQRLRRRKFKEEIIKKTLSYLKEKDLINDRLFAKTWSESRIKRPLGLRRIRQELRLKGVDRQIIDEELLNLKNDYAEAEIVKEIAKERLKRLRDIDPKKAKARIYGYLLRRGFSPEVIIDIIKETG